MTNTDLISRYYLLSHPDFLVVLDENQCIAELNDIARHVLASEFGSIPVAGDNMLQFLLPEARDLFSRQFILAWNGEDISPAMYGRTPANYVARLHPILSQTGGVCGVIYQRTLKSKLAELKVNDDTANRLQLVLEGADMGWWDWELDTHTLVCDPKWWAITGYPLGSLSLTSEFNSVLVHPDDKQTVSDAFMRALSSEKITFETETRLIHKDGHLVPIQLRGFILRDDKGNPIRITGTMADLSEKKKAEADFQHSENYLRTIFQNTETGYIFLDASLCVLSYNQKAEQIAYHLNNNALQTGGFILDVVTPEHLGNFKQALAEAYDGQRIEYERCNISGDNEEEWFYMRLSPVFSRENKVVNVIMTIEDITERKKDEIQLNKSFELVTAQNKRLLSFSYIVSHNLRSHSSNITSIVDFLSEAESEEERTEMIGHMKTVTQSLDETLSNLNDIISVQTSINPIFEPLLLSAFVRKAIDVLRDQVQHKDATIINNIDNNVVLNYNPAYIESIILNFVSNALKYSHPLRKPVITLSCQQENGKYVLTIEDNGIGIDLKKNGDKLFGLYKTFNGNPDARGLGLFITRNQVEYMGGKIEVESEVGKGTKFKIYF